MDDALNRCIMKSFVILWILILYGGLSYSDGFRIVCYFSTSAQYRSGEAAFHASNVEPFLCSHIVVSHARVSGTTIMPSEWSDIKVYDELLALKDRNPALQILLSVGHVLGLPEQFLGAVENDAARRSFAYYVLHYVRSKRLDGIILEWFNLAYKIQMFFDRDNFKELLRAIKNVFEEEARSTSRHKLTLAVTTSSQKKQIDKVYNLTEMDRLVDFFSIRTVDLRTAANRVTGPSSSLYRISEKYNEEADLNVNWAASYYVSLGVPAKKINIGIPTYGRTFTLARPGESFVGSPVSDYGHAGKLTGIRGIISHFEMCGLIREGGSVMRIPHNRYYVRDDQWISYEDSGSVMQKACYVQEKRYGGITVWTLDLDDFTGLGCKQGRYPLIATAAHILRSADYKLCTSKIWESIDLASAYSTKFPIRKSSENDLGSNRLVCYMTNWSRFRHGSGKFLPEDIDPNLCTHIIYAYGVVINKTIMARFPEEEFQPWGHGLYRRVLQAKEYNPVLKILLSVGGDGAGTVEFERASEDAASRRIFSVNAVRFLRDRGFDGLEVFWAYPSAKTSANLKELLQALRHAFDEEAKASDKDRLILTTALTASVERIVNGYGHNLVSMVMPTDFVSLMTYDFHGKWNVRTGMNSPLHAHEHEGDEEATLNVDYITHMYTTLGVPKHMINIGIPTYGISFKLKNPGDNRLGAPVSGPGTAGPHTGVDGMLAYYEVCIFIKDGAKKYYLPTERVPFAVKDHEWVGYEDAASVLAKTCYAINFGFGGVSIWTIDLDDFFDECKFGAFPLVNVVHNALKIGSGSCSRHVFLKKLRSTSGADRHTQSLFRVQRVEAGKHSQLAMVALLYFITHLYI